MAAVSIMNFSRTLKKITAGWFLILFMGYASCTTFFYHTHYVNGQWITHSHPYADAPDTGDHTHALSGFVTIALLSAFIMLAACSALFRKPFILLAAVIEGRSIRINLARKTITLLLRGPPYH